MKRAATIAALTMAACAVGGTAHGATLHHRHARSATTAPPAAVTYGGWAGETGILYNAKQTPTPTIIFIHGGGWVYGDLGPNGETFAADLASRLNWPVLAISYPTTDQGGTPARDVEQQAVNDAVHYAANKLPGTDPAHIILWGESAGGNLALLDDERDATHNRPLVSAAVSISGPTDLRDEWNVIPADVTQYEGETPMQADVLGHTRYETTSPYDSATMGMAPIFQAVGTDDTLDPHAQDEAMDASAQAVGTFSALYEVDGVSNHAQWLEPVVIPSTGNTVENQACKFLFAHFATRS